MSSSEEPNAASTPVGSLPPPPVPVIPPEEREFVEVAKGEEVIWHQGTFGTNGFGFYGNGQLGISLAAITLSGRRFLQPIVPIFGSGYFILAVIVFLPFAGFNLPRMPFAVVGPAILLYWLVVFILFLPLKYLFRRFCMESAIISINRFKVKDLRHFRSELIFTTPTEYGLPTQCIFYCKSKEESEAIFAELANTAQA